MASGYASKDSFNRLPFLPWVWSLVLVVSQYSCCIVNTFNLFIIPVTCYGIFLICNFHCFQKLPPMVLSYFYLVSFTTISLQDFVLKYQFSLRTSWSFSEPHNWSYRVLYYMCTNMCWMNNTECCVTGVERVVSISDTECWCYKCWTSSVNLWHWMLCYRCWTSSVNLWHQVLCYRCTSRCWTSSVSL